MLSLQSSIAVTDRNSDESVDRLLIYQFRRILFSTSSRSASISLSSLSSSCPIRYCFSFPMSLKMLVTWLSFRTTSWFFRSGFS